MVLSLFAGVLTPLYVFFVKCKIIEKMLKSYTVCYITFSCKVLNPANLNLLGYYNNFKKILVRKMLSLICLIAHGNFMEIHWETIIF